MDSYIRIDQILKKDFKVEIKFSTSQNLDKFFNSQVFWYAWDADSMPTSENLPDSIAVLPLIANILPLVWLTDTTLYVNKLDKNFYYSIDEFKRGYVQMYPYLDFKGKVVTQELEENEYQSDKNLILFSGGIDALTTTLRHIDENLETLTLWGSEDFPLDDERGWSLQKKLLEGNLKRLNLQNTILKTNFCEFIDSWNCHYVDLVKKGSYWHEMQHGIGIISHAAPYCYFNKIGICYIASSYTKDFLNIGTTCASDPSIDNYLRFGSTKVIHDGYEWNRQQKVAFCLSKLDELDLNIEVHVCLRQYQQRNCCECEKCIRTMLATIAEGRDPKSYGFDRDLDFNSVLSFMKNVLYFTDSDKLVFKTIQGRMLQNASNVLYPEAIKLMEIIDFDKINYTPRKTIHRILKRLGLNRIIVNIRKFFK